MSKRVPQSKRMQLIDKWLRGIEDDEFEVFPSKTEGKYFVRKRKEPLKIEQPKEEKIEEPIEKPKQMAPPPIPPPIPKPFMTQH